VALRDVTDVTANAVQPGSEANSLRPTANRTKKRIVKRGRAKKKEGKQEDDEGYLE